MASGSIGSLPTNRMGDPWFERITPAPPNTRRRNVPSTSSEQNRAAQISLQRNRSQSHQHPLSDEYESLNYERVESKLYKLEELSPAHQIVLWRQSINRWVICFLIGVITALIACFIDVMVYYAADVKFRITLSPLFERCGTKGCLHLALLAWIGFNCFFVTIAASLVLFFAGSVASGSGIPQIKCFLNGIMIPGAVRLKTLIAKALGVACSVAGGLSVGKEGPMIHSGAVVAAGISQGRCITIPFDFGVFGYFRSDHEKRDFVSAGAAAGVAAAFGAPIGGVLFSLEEGASFWNQSLTWRMFFSSMISSFTLSVVLSIFYQQSGMLSWPGLANFGTFKSIEYQFWELFVFILMGVFGGLSGALFNFINYKLSVLRLEFVRNRWQKLVECLTVATVSATAAFSLIYTLHDCQPIGLNPNMSEPIRLLCPNGEYNAVAELFFRSPEESVKSLFHSPSTAMRPQTLLAFASVYFCLTVWTYGLSVPSGLFIPTLLTGAAWGRLVGLGVERMLPIGAASIDPGKYALAGAAAQLGGVVRMTISLCAIIMEATRDISFGLPIMLILMTAKWVGDYFNEGLYDIHIELAEVPILVWEPPRASGNILAKRVMSRDVVTLECVERVGVLYDKLCADRHNGYPVVDDTESDAIFANTGMRRVASSIFSDMEDEDEFVDTVSPVGRRVSLSSAPPLMAVEGEENRPKGRLRGLALRDQLMTLLRHRQFYYDRRCHEPVEGRVTVTLRHFRDAHPRNNGRLDLIRLTDEDRRCWIDLKPFVNPSPYRVPVDASLPYLFQLFRGLGLRHIVVVDDDNRVEGIVTRKDLARYKEVRHGNKFKVKEMYINVTSNNDLS